MANTTQETNKGEKVGCNPSRTDFNNLEKYNLFKKVLQVNKVWGALSVSLFGEATGLVEGRIIKRKENPVFNATLYEC